MLLRIFFKIYRKIRIALFQLLSNQPIVGTLDRIQAVQAVGAGTITMKGRVSIGYFPSPHFFSTYGYLEARSEAAKIEIGNNTKINNGFVAIAEKSIIRIGENCLIGTCVEIYDSDFHALKASERSTGDSHECKPVTIGNDVFIGSNTKILKGVTIGNGSVIGNSSLVTKDIPENCLASGVPAKWVRSL